MDSTEVVPVDGIEAALDELSTTPAQAFLLNEISVPRALERLRQIETLPNSPPGIVCAVPGIRQAAERLGVVDYLVKPVSRDQLLTTLERLNLGGNTILVVDDEPDALIMFRRMLSSADRTYRVLRAGNGQQALDILSVQRPDAILLDLVMPRMDGFRLLERKSRDPALRDIPAIVISARDPLGQPIVSSFLTVAKRDGLSVHQVLACIEAVIEILSAGGRSPGAPAPRANPAG
jgi:CheY-like chemotaxis protein